MRGLILNQTAEGRTVADIKTLDEAQLPEGEVNIQVNHSAVNYKDALAVTGKGKIVRSFPFVPGIDLCGEVLSSQDDSFKPGQKVIATGWGIGEKHWGGYAERARLKAKWLTPLPANLNSVAAMTLGTAGITAELCVNALQDNGVDAKRGKVIVSGASGGVGSIAVKLLTTRGYEVTAVTSPEGQELAKALGANECIMRAEMASKHRPLESAKWAGAVDTVGGKILGRILAEAQYGGVVAACGLAGGFELNTTVMPFILRAARLVGIDSVYVNSQERVKLWQQLADELNEEFIQRLATVISLSEVPAYCERMLKGETTGRIVVDLQT